MPNMLTSGNMNLYLESTACNFIILYKIAFRKHYGTVAILFMKEIMQTELILTRHGETIQNAVGRFQGHFFAPFSATSCIIP